MRGARPLYGRASLSMDGLGGVSPQPTFEKTMMFAIERELAIARGLASCRGDADALDEADAELVALREENTRLREAVDAARSPDSLFAKTRDSARRLGETIAEFEAKFGDKKPPNV